MANTPTRQFLSTTVVDNEAVVAVIRSLLICSYAIFYVNDLYVMKKNEVRCMFFY